MSLPGFVEQGMRSPLYLRQLIFGPPKSGKSVYCGTWPAPLFFHPVVESGYDTFRLPDGTNLFPYVQLGTEYHLWLTEKLGAEKHRTISDELREWVRHLALEIDRKRCRYQTIVIGGFSVIQEMVHAEGDKRFPKDSQKAWGYVLRWSTELLQTLCTLPLHVIFESSATAVGGKDRTTGEITRYEASISGKTYNNLCADMNVILWQECLGGTYYTSVSTAKTATNGVRFQFLSAPAPIRDCGYDWFAERLGLPPIWVADPQHPRVTGKWWPWYHCPPYARQQ